MAEFVLAAPQAKVILAAKGKARVRMSPDLGLSFAEASLDESGLYLNDLFISWKDLERVIKEDRKVFRVGQDGLSAIQTFSEATGWVRSLCPTSGAPTVLVSGIPMHRIKDTDPMADTREKIRALGPIRGNVLDTATGAGYTAILAAKSAAKVTTIEIDPAAIDLARDNPYARDLFDNPKIEIVIGDALELVPTMTSGSFSAIIHDPPTMALGGELYSEEFYRALLRVLSQGGKMFHYISDPDSHLGKKQWPGVMRRLHGAGFKRVERHPAAYGVVALA